LLHEEKTEMVMAANKKSQLSLLSDFVEWVSICVFWLLKSLAYCFYKSNTETREFQSQMFVNRKRRLFVKKPMNVVREEVSLKPCSTG
jgi:hypothetical protein